MSIDSSSWGPNYELYISQLYAEESVSGPTPGLAEQKWGLWVTTSSSGMMVIPPYSTSLGSGNPPLWAPMNFPPGGSPAIVAQGIATCWENWFLGTTWSIPLPIPPFSAITAVIPSSAGAASAKSTLISQLTAEFALLSSPSETLAVKGAAIGAYIEQAIKTAGVDIIGISNVFPFPPLILPQIPIM